MGDGFFLGAWLGINDTGGLVKMAIVWVRSYRGESCAQAPLWDLENSETSVPDNPVATQLPFTRYALQSTMYTRSNG